MKILNFIHSCTVNVKKLILRTKSPDIIIVLCHSFNLNLISNANQRLRSRYLSIIEDDFGLFLQSYFITVLHIIDCQFTRTFIAVSTSSTSALHLDSGVDWHKSNDDMESPSFIESASYFEISPSACQIGSNDYLLTIYVIINLLFPKH